jgi:hypothetical protein
LDKVRSYGSRWMLIGLIFPLSFLLSFSHTLIKLTDEVQELELKVDANSLDKLLQFLSCSFMGGTDVDRPLKLSLDRLTKQEWAQVGWAVVVGACYTYQC